MKWSTTLLLVALLLAALFLVPVFPVSAFFGWSASSYGVADVHSAVGLSEDDVEAIVELVSGHPSYGNDSRYPRRLSLKQYILDFENVGFQAIGSIPLGFDEACPDCSAAAFAGVTRNTSDVAGTMYFLAKNGEAWHIREVRDGVTGMPVSDE